SKWLWTCCAERPPMPPSRPIPRRRFITDEPTMSTNWGGLLPPSLRSIRGKNSFWRIKANGTGEVPISSHIYYFVEFPRWERRYMAFPLQSPTFLVVALGPPKPPNGSDLDA